jgi:ABC-type multidrug transport system fused ATPase/permease subunit
MLQEPVLFNGTVFENVSYGLFGTNKAGLPDEQKMTLVEKACKAAYADEFIDRLPRVSYSLSLNSSCSELTPIGLSHTNW